VFLKQALLRGMTSKNVQAPIHVTWSPKKAAAAARKWLRKHDVTNSNLR
jgi:hypothetical protein